MLSKVGVEYEYTIEVDGPNPFILSPDGGKYEIPFACKRKKYVAGEFTEEEYAPLKGLRYNMGTNYGTYTSIIKDGDTVGLYKFVKPEYAQKAHDARGWQIRPMREPRNTAPLSKTQDRSYRAVP